MKLLINLQKKIIFITSVMIIFGLTLSVVLRYILKLDLFAIEELLIIPTFLLYFIGAAQGSYEDSHISADMTEIYVKNNTIRRLIQLFIAVITLITCLIITYWNAEYLSWSFSHGGKTQGWGIPMYVPHGTVLLGFILMTLYSSIHLYIKAKSVVEVFKK
ncbi:TRAP transporter small permease [Salirhabdus salicampi]|uniref:TRAP transporter small permease n=1 Tax=Salirhabdus salicampi TaxID=476102 RepID=UPI0020C455D1|nr:TRAP transporter small permease [Salirhabdus salicampi]MCP8616340.1 TRAP transporter small permease [Salirhabdus salicampi]